MNAIVNRPKNTYQWRRGSVLRADPDSVGRRLEELCALHGGQVDTEVMAQDAMNPDSPLHECVEHDMELAAWEYLKAQVRYIANSLVIVTIIPVAREETVSVNPTLTIDAEIIDDEEEIEGEQVVVRAFPRVQHAYTPFQAVMSNGAYRDEYIKSLLERTKSLGKQLADFRIFEGVVNAIRQLPDQPDEQNRDNL